MKGKRALPKSTGRSHLPNRAKGKGLGSSRGKPDSHSPTSQHSGPKEGSAFAARRDRQQPGSEREMIEIIQVAPWEELAKPGPGSRNPAAPWLLHGFSTRSGASSRIRLNGRSGGAAGPARSGLNLGLNLGFTQGADHSTVLKNRDLFLRTLLRDRAGFQLVTLRQVHSSLIWRVGSEALSGGSELTGDGLITSEPGLLLGILTADCLPILVADLRNAAVGAFHAGWRGTLARIVEKGVGRMRMEFGSRPEDMVAAIGPGIGPCCYSVGEEVRQQFESQFENAEEMFREVYDTDPIRQKYPMLFLTARAPGHSDLGPALHLDLPAANRRQLMAAGLRPEAIHLTGECTFCSPRRFFSYRREQALSGRMMSVIGILPSPGSG